MTLKTHKLKFQSHGLNCQGLNLEELKIARSVQMDQQVKHKLIIAPTVRKGLKPIVTNLLVFHAKMATTAISKVGNARNVIDTLNLCEIVRTIHSK